MVISKGQPRDIVARLLGASRPENLSWINYIITYEYFGME